ncbi:GntR family transcriptional regulator [Corynebacterium suicordis]|uniref:GntR family transcriptional regulator n=1 Tax=Corynebacterium suicordis DSM 45110 TaxID=1121369 RepID=A0ABR9ZLD5_9CORY|nr:GntR family transcriptional regulator [Corynebacterium suicordis]MBF4554084.1 GntR family transcriptional regulator [Corynebacterium suicordis DSM 45110]MDR6276937.1 DNA-binding GntR family transcriptional regulator [Corynebacterium suicordis]
MTSAISPQAEPAEPKPSEPKPSESRPAVNQSDLAAEELTRRISSGEFMPGEKLNEVAISTQLNISRNTLREAFATLVQQGLVTRIPHRGVFITKPTLTQLEEIYALRHIIEPGALLWGSREGLDNLDAIVRRAERARDAAGPDLIDATAVSNANHEFHRAIVASAHSKHLDTVMSRVLAQMRLAFLHATQVDPSFHTRFIADNRKVADLVSAGDFPGAADVLAHSLSTTRHRLASIFAEPQK